MEKIKTNKHLKLIVVEVIFLFGVFLGIYFAYPWADVNIEGNVVKFDSISAEIIVISENSDFSNSRYLEIEKGENISFELPPGKYYWKSDNGIIESLKNEFVVQSEVAMEINREENKSELENVGNVKINITKNEGGIIVGHIILGPDNSEEIQDEEDINYKGKQE